MVLVLTPWTIRNFSVFDRFVLISTNAGAVIGGAKCESTYYGSNIGGWNFLCATPFPGNEAEQTAKQQREGIDFAADHVTRLPVVAAARLMRQWSFYRPWQTNPGRAGWAQNAGVVTYYVLLPLALYGLLVLWRRKAPIWVIAAPLMLSCAQAVLRTAFSASASRRRSRWWCWPGWPSISSGAVVGPARTSGLASRAQGPGGRVHARAPCQQNSRFSCRSTTRSSGSSGHWSAVTGTDSPVRDRADRGGRWLHGRHGEPVLQACDWPAGAQLHLPRRATRARGPPFAPRWPCRAARSPRYSTRISSTSPPTSRASEAAAARGGATRLRSARLRRVHEPLVPS